MPAPNCKGLTSERLREVLDYDPTTGTFRWRVNRTRARAGSVAGCNNSGQGYVRIEIDGYKHLAHRLAWLFVHSEWPSGEIDHVDRCRSNNAIANLRAATRQQNLWNASIRSDNPTGLKGVRPCRSNEFVAIIKKDGKQVKLGIFKTPSEAAQAYDRAAVHAYGEFAHTNTESLPPKNS